MLEDLIKRLEKLGIRLELIGNYPWIYVSKICGKTVKEKYLANHGFTIAFTEKDGKHKISNTTEVFKLIRKYIQ